VNRNVKLLYGFSFFNPFMIDDHFGMALFFGWPGIVFGLLIQISRGLGDVLFLNALNEEISSAFRATVISMTNVGTRGSFVLVGPLVDYGIDAWGLPSVLSALGIVSSIVFVALILPLVVQEGELIPADTHRERPTPVIRP